MLAGISPQIAQSMVLLGVDLADLSTFANLQSWHRRSRSPAGHGHHLTIHPQQKNTR